MACYSIVLEIPRFKRHYSINHVLIWHPLLTGETLAERSLEP